LPLEAFGFTSIMNKISVPTSNRKTNVSIKDTNQLLLFPEITDNLFSEYNQQNATFFKFIYFCKMHGFSVHHHELKTALTASGICQTVTACYLVSLARLAADGSNGLTNA
jgi:hypothetical protein